MTKVACQRTKSFVARGLASRLRLKRRREVGRLASGDGRQRIGFSLEIETGARNSTQVTVQSRQRIGFSLEIETTNDRRYVFLSVVARGLASRLRLKLRIVLHKKHMIHCRQRIGFSLEIETLQ